MSRQHQFEIQNLRTTEAEALAERIFGLRHQRWEALAGQLKKSRTKSPDAIWRRSRPRVFMILRCDCARKSTGKLAVLCSLSRPSTFPSRNGSLASMIGQHDLLTGQIRQTLVNCAPFSRIRIRNPWACSFPTLLSGPVLATTATRKSAICPTTSAICASPVG